MLALARFARHAPRSLQPPALAGWSGAGMPSLLGAVRHDWKGPPMPKGYKHRADTIKIDHVGKSFYVHSGRAHIAVKPTVQMIDHKFGEFVPTRKRAPVPKGRKQRR